ncbi:MAG: hypothetical protein KC501_16720 [Myxococcales bacterium]|nr:hypothetical protein [Myxococcales bacterium]
MSDALQPAAAPATAVRHEETVGRARRLHLEDGAELWRFADPNDPAARRLAAAEGVGGFGRAGVDEQGAWLWRAPAPLRLDAWLRDGARPWDRVGPVARSLVARLGWCEAHALFPGPLRPEEVAVDETRGEVVLRADALAQSLAGAFEARATGSPGLSRWVPPEQARGEPWDNAANRYVVGLVLYRALAGHHPFSGQGLRRGLEAQAQQGAPPFDEAVARGLPPGLQSLCLQLLDPDPSRRPGSARMVADRLDGLSPVVAERVAATPRARTVVPAIAGATQARRDRLVAAAGGEPPSAAPRAAAPSTRSRPRSAWWSRLAMVLPVVAGLGLAIALGSVVEPPPAPAKSPSVGAATPLGLDQSESEDCATCHPRQVAQWTQSVMAHSARSPMFQALEMLIEEQVGRSFDCPDGAGALRTADPRTACIDPSSGLPITGSGGELWCVNCHAVGENLRPGLPAWDGRGRDRDSHLPLRDLLPAATMEGISCVVCHTTHGPVRPGNESIGRYEGNPSWVSFVTGQRFFSRPEDARGQPGIANSGYELDPAVLLAGFGGVPVPGGAHVRPEASTRQYLQTSEFCGACHDVRLFGTDVIGVRERGEHFKRLRNAYSEWSAWADDERRRGREPASCQDCHMSQYPGVCVADGEGDVALASAFLDDGATALRRACPPGTHFEAREPGAYPDDRASLSSAPGRVSTHYFSGVDAPLTAGLSEELLDDPRLDEAGLPRGLRPRRDLLLGRTFRFELRGAARRGDRVEIPIEIENVGAGHRVPAGFSQEREIWVHLKVSDADGRVLYEVGRVERGDEDLPDKRFVRVNVDDRFTDGQGAPQGVFGADVIDGPDLPRWSPPPITGATRFRGEGLINLQNGFLRCVTCIGEIDAFGHCQPSFGQGRTRADRFADGVYDLDTGECRSNLVGEQALFETYFPVGALDATRGATKGPDAIIDTRSAPPGVPLTYVYDLPLRGGRGPLTVEARLMFRAFPPFLVRAFADYELQQAARGLRPSGPLVTHDMLDRLEVVELHRVRVEIP